MEKWIPYEKLSTAGRFTNWEGCAIMLTSGEKGRKNDDSHVHDQQMQKAAAETRLWEACICDGLMDKQENRAGRSGFRDQTYRNLNFMKPQTAYP